MRLWNDRRREELRLGILSAFAKNTQSNQKKKKKNTWAWSSYFLLAFGDVLPARCQYLFRLSHNGRLLSKKNKEALEVSGLLVATWRSCESGDWFAMRICTGCWLGLWSTNWEVSQGGVERGGFVRNKTNKHWGELSPPRTSQTSLA